MPPGDLGSRLLTENGPGWGDTAEFDGVCVNRSGSSRIEVRRGSEVGPAGGGSRLSGDSRCGGKSRAEGEPRDVAVGDFLSKVRIGFSLFFMLSQYSSALVWNLYLLWATPNPDGKESFDLE